MSTRIRYKNQNGTLVSKSFKTPTDEAVVNIKSDGSFAICNLNGELLFNSTYSIVNDLAKSKKDAKKALISLGVSFESEVRPRFKSDVISNMLLTNDETYTEQNQEIKK